MTHRQQQGTINAHTPTAAGFHFNGALLALTESLSRRNLTWFGYILRYRNPDLGFREYNPDFETKRTLRIGGNFLTAACPYNTRATQVNRLGDGVLARSADVKPAEKRGLHRVSVTVL